MKAACSIAVIPIWVVHRLWTGNGMRIFALDVEGVSAYEWCMRSFLGMLLVLLIFLLVVGGSGLIWYLSDTAGFTRSDRPAAVQQR